MKLKNLSSDERIRFYVQVGRLLIHAPSTAKFAGHSDMFGTLAYYLCTNESHNNILKLAIEYLNDLGLYSHRQIALDELIEKWSFDTEMLKNNTV
jgi:hypothetical protein